MEAELIRKYGEYVERCGWLQVLFGILTSVSAEYAFPSYNVALGFWAVYCAYTKHGRATFGFITFEFLTVFLDIIFCSLYGSVGKSSGFKFALAMFIFCLFVKLFALYSSAHYFAYLGGPSSLDAGMGQSALLDSLNYSTTKSTHGGYYPPNDHEHDQDDIGRSTGSGGGDF